MKAIKFFNTVVMSLPVLLLSLFFTFRLAFAQSDVVHVDSNGSQAPDGSAVAPYQLIEAGVCKVNENGIVVIQGGNYHEQITLNKPATLTAAGGTAVIGQLTGKAHTTLKILTYNTHLFGDEALGVLPTFADEQRAPQIADRIRKEDADVVAFQEVWDEELADVIISQADYPYYFYSNEHDEVDDILNSGLLLLSKYPIDNPSLNFYNEEASCSPPLWCGLIPEPILQFACIAKNCYDNNDAFASKGFIGATIEKEGFRIAIFITHTDASDAGARRGQIKELGLAISQYHIENPNTEVIALGDFNVSDGGQDYYRALLPNLGLRDAFLNTACFSHLKGRLDYIFYSHGNVFDVLPTYGDLASYSPDPPIDGVSDLSDHPRLVIVFSLYR
ncbi:MAG: endonuclease/exonuclease/phosphatase family protein [Caldilineaceae bacterium]